MDTVHYSLNKLKIKVIQEKNMDFIRNIYENNLNTVHKRLEFLHLSIMLMAESRTVRKERVETMVEKGAMRTGKTDGGRARLREAIRDGRFLAGTYLPSARDLARRLGIPKSSVHNILKLLQEEGLIQIYPGCGALVLENAEARRKFHRIFVRPSDFGTFRYLPVTAELLQGVTAGAEKQNVELLLSLSDSGRITDEMIAHHMAGTIQGVIYLQCANYPELIVPLEKAKIPCVIAADNMDHTEAVRTFIDFRAAAREAVRYLVRHGHRRIGILTGSEKQFLYSEMLAGFRGALAEENLPFDPQWCLTRLEYEQSADQVGVIARFLKRVPREELPTAFFTVRDYRAGWFFEAAEQLGLRIPEEISLLSFDNHTWRGAEQAKLTTFAEPLREQGEQAVKLLGDWVLSGSRPASVEFKPKLIERASVSAPRTV